MLFLCCLALVIAVPGAAQWLAQVLIGIPGVLKELRAVLDDLLWWSIVVYHVFGDVSRNRPLRDIIRNLWKRSR